MGGSAVNVYKLDKNSLLYRMLNCEGHSSPAEYLKNVGYLMAIGKNPSDAVSWIEFIIETTCDNYGDPTSKARYCHIDQKQLENAFRYLTGVEACGKTLWNILSKKMGYTPHPLAKLEQVGKPSPQKEQQLKHIVFKLRSALRSGKILVLSIDTKAAVTLGRVRNDNGVVMCAPGTVYPVDMHNFPFKLAEVQPNGSPLLGEEAFEERKDEPAVLRPVGALCLNDMSGSVALVIGKDTAESVRNMLFATITKKVAEMKEKGITIESVLILADGGGSNNATSVTWLSEMKKLANSIRMPIDFCHYPTGCSKRNPVEHFLWGAISTHWRGHPLLTIELVAQYITEAGLCNENLSGIDCWVDPIHYKTNAAKKAAGVHVPTRKELDLDPTRIIYEFKKDEDGDMYKLNYTIVPTELKSVSESNAA